MAVGVYSNRLIGEIKSSHSTASVIAQSSVSVESHSSVISYSSRFEFNPFILSVKIVFALYSEAFKMSPFLSSRNTFQEEIIETKFLGG